MMSVNSVADVHGEVQATSTVAADSDAKPTLQLRKPPTEYASNAVALASFPRSGNSLLRSLVEKVTGFYTGSDNQSTTLLSQDLKKMGLRGEGEVQGMWIVKTHFPERKTPSAEKAFKAKKVILLCRNPFDVLDSYFNMVMTGEHTRNVDDELYTSMASQFANLVKSETRVWVKFHEYWIHAADTQKVALHVVKYEDILLHPRKVLTDLEEFLSRETVGIEDRQDFAARIEEIISNGSVQTGQAGVYKPRTVPKIFKSARRYSEELRRAVLFEARKTLARLGYDSLLSESPFQNEWLHIRKRVPERLFSTLNAWQTPGRGVKVNGSASIRSSMSTHGRGFDWKFEFFQNHKFASREAAVAWATKYLGRQVQQKVKLGRDLTKIEEALKSQRLRLEDVLADP